MKNLNKDFTNDKKYINMGLFYSIILLGGSFAWASFAPLKSAVVSEGIVVVEDRNKIIQHLDGGNISDIFVKEGDIVKKEQLLIKLSDTEINSQINTIKNKILENKYIIKRLNSERNFSDFLFTDEENEYLFYKKQESIFKTKKELFEQEQKIIQNQNLQIKEQIKGLNSIINSQKNQLNSLTEDIKDLKLLYEKKYVDKVKMKEIERSVFQLEGDIANKLNEIQKLNQIIIENERKMILAKENILKTTLSELSEKERENEELKDKLSVLNDKKLRVNIVSPVEGRIVDFNYYNKDMVIKPMQDIMKIVPEENNFSIIANVKLTDIDLVKIGQEVEVKFSAYNTSYLPVLKGKVISIPADAVYDEKHKDFFYKVVLKPNLESLKLLKNKNWNLISGMPAETFLITKEITLMNYLLKSLRVMFSKSLNEDDGV